MNFYWIELLASVTAFELMVIIVGNTVVTILVTLITDYLSFYEYFGILSLALGFLCLKYADGTVTSTPPNRSENASAIDMSTVARTITGLCLVGFVVGTTQSIALIEDPSCSLYSNFFFPQLGALRIYRSQTPWVMLPLSGIDADAKTKEES